MTDLPLTRFTVIKTHDLDHAREEVAKIFCPHRLEITNGVRLDARHHNVDLGGFSLNYVQYGADVRIEPGELGTFFLLQVPLGGHAKIRCGPHSVQASSRRASLLSPTLDVSMRWSDDCSKLLVQLPRLAMEHALEAMLGRSLGRAIEFDAGVSLETEPGRRIAQIVHLLRDDLDSATPVFVRSGAGPRMRETLMMALLRAVHHNYGDALLATPPGIAPRHVRQAEEYMRARAADQLTMSEIASNVGVSARALQEGFRRFRNTTPMSALHAMRLHGARAALLRAGPEDSVTTIALSWGFVHLSRFAASYHERFHERPSETLRRRRTV